MTQVLEPETAPRSGRGDRLRVTVVQQGGTVGGAELWQLQLADATERIDLEVVTLGAGPAAQEWTRRGVRVTTVRAERGRSRIPLVAVRVGAALRASNPDVVVAHGVKPTLVASPMARALGVPLVWVRHDGSFGGWPTALLDRLTEGQIATGAWLFEGRSPRNALLLNPPRTGDHLSREEAREALGLEIPAGRLVAAMGTRIVHGKGIDDAISALTDPAAAAWDLVIAGIHDPEDPGEQDRLVTLAAELGVQHRVRFLGEVRSFSRYARAFDAVLVLTKPTAAKPWHREAFGMAAFEALAAGVAVVVTPPLGALARGGGIEVRPGAPADVAAALGDLEDPDARARRGTAGARVAASYPDAPAAADLFVDFLAGPAHRPGAGLRPTAPAISVVTTPDEGEAAAKELLSALVPQLGPRDEVIVVDGGSVDGTVDVVQAFAAFDDRVRLIVAPRTGVAQRRNIGVRAAVHDRIACTQAACIPVPGWLSAFRRAFARHPDVDLWTGSHQLAARGAWEHAAAAVDQVRSRRRLLGRAPDPSMPAAHSFAFARVAWASVGGFSEDTDPEAVDVVLGRAIAAGGGRAELVRDAVVGTVQRPTLRGSLRLHRARGAAVAATPDLRTRGAELARVAAYAAVAGVALRGSATARGAVAVGAVALVARPLAHSLHGPMPLRSAALVPAVVVADDLARSYGVLAAAWNRGRSPR